MKNTMKFSFAVHISVVTALLFGTQLATAQTLSHDVGTGSVIELTERTLSGQASGPFNGKVFSGPGVGSSFLSFCVERLEYFAYNSSLYVQGITTITTNAPGAYPNNSTSDPLSYQSAWLFTQYSNNVYGQTVAINDAMQQAFWHLEDDLPLTSLNNLAQTYVSAANTAVANGYTGYGNVRVMNLFSNASYTSHAQDQLVILSPIPEPQSFALLLAGLGLLSVAARRRQLTSFIPRGR